MFVLSVIFTSTYVFVGQWSRGSHVGLYFPVLIGKEIRVFSQFKHLAQGLIPVLQLLVRTCASRHQTVATVFFLQRQDTPTGPERFWRILHGTLHFTEIVQYDIVYFRGTSEEFLQVLVIGAIMTGQVVLLFPGISVRNFV